MLDYSTSGGALLQRVLECAERNDDLLVTPDAERLVNCLVDSAVLHGCAFIAGASDTGKMLVGAMIVAAQGRLRPWRPGLPGPVMVVDGYTDSPIALNLMARQAATWGAEVRAVMVSCADNRSVRVLAATNAI